MSQRLERPRAAAARCGISISQLYREVKAGRIAPPVKVGERASAFPSDEIDRFINGCIKAGRKQQAVVDAIVAQAAAHDADAAAIVKRIPKPITPPDIL